MCLEANTKTETLVIFFPFDVKNIRLAVLCGDYQNFNQVVNIFFTTTILHSRRGRCYEDIFEDNSKPLSDSTKCQLEKNSICVEMIRGRLTIKQVKINGVCLNRNRYEFLWIGYSFKLFALCELSPSEEVNAYGKESYFKHLKDKMREQISMEKKKRSHHMHKITNAILTFVNVILLKLMDLSVRLLPVTKYFNITIHIDNYLGAFSWAVKSIMEKKKPDIKVTNFLLSVFLDMVLGILFLNWLNSKVSLDSSASIFLLTAESVINSINDLINWLRGDPAGLKLNWAFNKILATFFSFHIEIWWTFLVYLKPLVKIIFQIFLKLGLLGITFQASITADLLALVSFHVYCIQAYAAKLYSIQMSSLISLWRLFLGRKKNPLRGKVDSCRYSPKQLFVGTLAFTILLFLLPTTLLYYVVFTSIKSVILILEGILMLIQYFIQTLPIYTTLLWLTKSPKIFIGIEIESFNEVSTSNFILLNVKPGMCGWWETVSHFTPDCAARPKGVSFSAFLNSVVTGKHLNQQVQQ